MQPNTYARNTRRPNRLLIWLVALVLLTLLGWLIYYTQTFHIIKTDPKMSSVAQISPYVRVYYSHTLDSGSLKYTASSDIIRSQEISGKVLTLWLRPTMVVGKQYIITISNVADERGTVLKDEKLTFVVKDLKFKQLSKDQQAAILKNQDTYDYNVYSVQFPGFDQLLDYGVPATQLQNIKQSIFDYSQVVNKQFRTIGLVDGSISKAPHNPASADTHTSVYFSSTFNNGTYAIHATYDELEDSLYQLQILDTNGTVVYDTLSAGD